MNKKNVTAISTTTGLEAAVIGIAGKFPGSSDCFEYWENLKSGKELISFFKKSELREAGIDDQFIRDPNYIRAHGVLAGIEYFDAAFFDYSPLEAEMMDPQLRLFFEHTWEALEDAGYNPFSFNDLIGLFAGNLPNFYWESLVFFSAGRKRLGNFATSHLTDREYLTTQVSYRLNLKGPSFLVQTACSTSLLAIHQACRALLTGECNLALAGGVSISIPQKQGYIYQEGLIMSSQGHCRAFDARADGTVGGNGLGVVVLKLLKKALAEGDHIYAVIKGSAINNDGKRKVGYTAPSIEGQAEVIKTALRVARVKPGSISYVETHGTGTPLGDPIEIEALKLVFGTGTTNRCAIGSVKTNVGHLYAAAGAAGFIKTVLALKYRLIPPSLNFESPNPKIDFRDSPFYVNTGLLEWKNEDDQPLRAGVSSFGIGGTNVHVVLEEAPIYHHDSVPGVSTDYRLVLLSARTASALAQAAENLAAFLKQNPQPDLADAAYTLQVGRVHFQHRKMLVASTGHETITALTTSNNEFVRDSMVENIKRPIIFMFPGQGCQYVNMGLDLYRTQSIFRDEIDNCFNILKSICGYDMKEILYPGEPGVPGKSIENDINQTRYSQPILFIFEYALAKMLMEWGIKPGALMGHSLGEYTAACLSGIFSIQHALELVTLRGKLMQGMPTGSMLSISISPGELQSFLNREQSVAAVNSPRHCVVSGTHDSIENLEKHLKEKGYRCKHLYTTHAYHSKMMDPVLKEFEKNVKSIEINEPGIPIISNLTGEWLTPGELRSPGYWSKHLRNTVRFSAGIEELLKLEHSVFIEVGPGKVLSTFIREHNELNHTHHIIDLIRHPDKRTADDYFLLKQIGRLWLRGVNIDWNEFHRGEKRFRISLPTYPFESQYYWPEGNLFKLQSQMFAGGVELKTGEPVIEVQEKTGKTGPDTGTAAEKRQQPGLNTHTPAVKDRIEQKLIETWQHFFGSKQVGLFDDFFDLGGNSLMASILIAEIHKELNVKIPLAELFNSSTVKELADYIKKSVNNKYQMIPAVEKKEFYPLSSAQKRLYFLHHLEKNTTNYNLPVFFIMEGEITVERFKHTLDRLIARHESFRTSVQLINGKLLQKTNREAAFEIEYHESFQDIDKIIQHFIRPFQLEKAPLIRVGLIKIRQQEHLLMIDMHHIISDGTSLGILINDFVSIHEGKDLPGLAIRYKDYAEWENKQKDSEELKKQKEFRLNEFAGELPVLDLPADFARPAIQSFSGSTIDVEIPGSDLERLKKLAADQDTTLFITLLSIYSVFLARLSGQEDIVVGTPIAGRRQIELHNIIGMFVNTLALRNYPLGEITFAGFLERTAKRVLKSFENQDYQFEEMIEELTVRRDTSRNPVFDVMFALQNLHGFSKDIPGLKIKPYKYENKISKFDLSLIAVELKDKLALTVEYCTALFQRATIERFIVYFKNILSGVLDNPGKKITDFEILSDKEKHLLIIGFNDTTTEYPQNKTLPELFREQAGKKPDHPAVVFADQHLTYEELNGKANQLAVLLRQNGVKPESIVGIMVQCSVEMITGIWGILKAGGAYLPITPTTPPQRIQYMINDSGVDLILTQYPFLPEIAEKYNTLDLGDGQIYTGDGSNLQNLNTSTDLAYTLYTSGSTGRPKGVLIEHKNVINLVTGLKIRVYREYKRNLRVSLLAPYVFDASVQQVFAALLMGHSLYIIPENLRIDGTGLLEFYKKHDIDISDGTPTHLQLLVECIKKDTPQTKERHFLIGGEALPPRVVEDFFLKTGPIKPVITNVYGPTECCVDSTSYRISGEDIESAASIPTIPIGKPMPNLYVFILAKTNKLSPLGVPGELCLGGDSLGRGYLNNPEMTVERFIFIPVTLYRSYMSYRTNIIYKTGDIARWMPNGDLEFISRLDHQVKIRGFRLELGEVENQLLKLPGIKNAVVLVKEDEAGAKCLCAYYVPKTDREVPGLRNDLSRMLPDYMIPAYFVPMEVLPMTPNGKIHRKALPDPKTSMLARKEYSAPEDDIEEKIVEAWQEVLGIEKIGREDNFFEIGGDSIKAIFVSSQLQKYGLKLEISDLFLFPRAKELARCIKKVDREIDQGPVTGEVPLTPIQHSFFQHNKTCRHHFNQALLLYNDAGFAEETLKKVLAKIVEHHDALRMVFTDEDNKVIQWNRGITGKLFDFQVINLKNEGDIEARIEKETHRQQKEIHLESGPLLKLCLFKTGKGDFLAMVIHHLVVDGVSWRIWLEDLAAGYDRVKRGEAPGFQRKTDSYQYWAHRLKEYSKSKKLLKELEYWKTIEENKPMPLPVDHEIGPGEKKLKNAALINMSLDKAQTHRLLTEVNQAYNTNINDILLTALVKALRDWTGLTRVWINLEGHGREEIIQGIDISRTIGWFTSFFPVILEVGPAGDTTRDIKLVKETLRKIPQKGIGYGILRYLTPGEKKPGTRLTGEPDISFNYLGQFDRENESGLFKISRNRTGESKSPESAMQYKIDINGMLIEEKLQIQFTYNRYQYRKTSIETFAGYYKSGLIDMIQHCTGKEESQLTPGDLTFSDLSLEELEKLENKINLIS